MHHNNDEVFFKYQEVWKWFLEIYGILFIFKEMFRENMYLKPILILSFYTDIPPYHSIDSYLHTCILFVSKFGDHLSEAG